MVVRYASVMGGKRDARAIGDYMTAAEVAALLGVSPGRVRQLTMEGRLSAAPAIAGRRFYRRDDVERFARGRSGRPVRKG
jgi:excisionase family DNA binding protein